MASFDSDGWGAASGIDALAWQPRWTDGPPDDAYSRVTAPERYRMLHAFALAVLDDLEREFDVEREELDALTGGAADHVDVERVVRLVPADPAAGPLTVALTGFPGVMLRFGEHTDLPLPACGCDACDESIQYLRDELRFRVGALVAGGFAERGAADGSTWHEFITDSGSSGGSSAGDGPGPYSAYDHDWAPWPRR